MQSIVGVIENKWGKSLKGIEKAEVATGAVVKIAEMYGIKQLQI